MSLPSNGITPDVIHRMMPPYHLSQDLLQAAVAVLPPPPPAAPLAWRHARITRLVDEVATLMPANAGQARLAAQILTVRELADAITARAYAPELTVPQMCRVGNAAANLVRTAVWLERQLARQQQTPVAFSGTVVVEAVDVAALDTAWGTARGGHAAEARENSDINPMQQSPAREAAAREATNGLAPRPGGQRTPEAPAIPEAVVRAVAEQSRLAVPPSRVATPPSRAATPPTHTAATPPMHTPGGALETKVAA